MNRIITGDALTELIDLPSKSVNCIVTSPPYYNLRDYGVFGQIGLEETPGEYIEHLITIFRQAYRVLKDDGTLWVNIGDSYSGSKRGRTVKGEHCSAGKISKNSTGQLSGNIKYTVPDPESNLKQKDLIGIPWMLAFALRNDGWYLRQDIIWQKPNAMPESVKDRCTRSHEYIFLLSKSRTYYFDYEAILEPRVGDNNVFPAGSNGTLRPNSRRRGSGNKKRKPRPSADILNIGSMCGNVPYTGMSDLRNKRDIWTIPTRGYKGAHFATFPPDLVEPCILAGCPVGGTVLDFFSGSGTVGVIAQKLGREFILIDLNPQYTDISRVRTGTL